MRVFKWIVILLIVLGIGVAIVWNMAPGWITGELSRRMGVEVTIGHLGLSTSSVSVKKVRIANPKGYKQRDALRVKKIVASLPLTRFFDKTIVIDTITADNVYLDLEFDEKGSPRGNWSILVGNLSSSFDDDETKKEGKNVLIKKLTINDIAIDLVYIKENKVQKLKPIKQIVLRNIRSDGPFPTAQLTDIIMKEMLKEIFSLNNLLDMMQELLSPGGSGNVFKNLFSKETSDASTPSSDMLCPSRE